VIDGMPRPRPPHLHREVTRHGRVVWFVRIGKGPRTRIRAEFGTPQFTAAYHAIIAGTPTADSSQFNAKTLGWLIEQYRESVVWSKFASETRRQREGILRAICKSAGRESYLRVDKSTIEKGIERRQDRPHAARHFLQTMRGLFAWAVKAKHVSIDPTKELKAIPTRTDGYVPWTDEWCDRFEKRWVKGTRERLAYDVLLYTGLRRGDAVRLGRPHVRNGIASVRTEKTGQLVTIPVLPPLQDSLEAGPIGELTFIASEHGQPMSKQAFGNWFRRACRKANVPGSAHGLRKAGATRAANNGATEAQLEAIFGWRGGGMASLYTRQANREKLAREAATKLLREQDTNFYSRTSKKVRERNPKTS
jgi:integrase